MASKIILILLLIGLILFIYFEKDDFFKLEPKLRDIGRTRAS